MDFYVIICKCSELGHSFCRAKCICNVIYTFWMRCLDKVILFLSHQSESWLLFSDVDVWKSSAPMSAVKRRAVGPGGAGGTIELLCRVLVESSLLPAWRLLLFGGTQKPPRSTQPESAARSVSNRVPGRSVPVCVVGTRRDADMEWRYGGENVNNMLVCSVCQDLPCCCWMGPAPPQPFLLFYSRHESLPLSDNRLRWPVSVFSTC